MRAEFGKSWRMQSKGAGVLLAAGASRRMGEPKALMPWGRTTFAGHLSQILLSLPLAQRGVVCRFPLDCGLPEWTNPDPERGMLSSLQVALQNLQPGLEWMMVCLVDQPSISATTFQRMMAQAQAASWSSPVYLGQRGHPVVIGRACFDALRQADPQASPRQVLSQFPRQLVEVEDPAVCLDFDTPEQWQAFLDSQKQV